MKKILIISHNFLPESTGGASRVFRLAQILQKNYDVTVLCPPPTYPFTKYDNVSYLFKNELINGIKIKRIWTYQPKKINPSFLSRFFYYLFFPLLSFGFIFKTCFSDTIFLFSSPPPSTLISIPFVKLFHKKIIVDVRDLWIDVAEELDYVKNKFLIKITKKFEISSWKKADIILSNSKVILEKINLYTNQSKPVFYLPYTIDSKLFYSSSISSNNHVVYLGNMGIAQNITVFVKSIPKIISDFSNFQFHLFGGGDDEINLKKLVIDLNLTNYVFFHDPISREEISQTLAKFSIGLVPLLDNKSLIYAMPTKAFEYMACGIPIFAYGSSKELQRIIQTSQSGIFVKGNNPDLISDEFINLLKNTNNKNVFSKNGKDFIQQFASDDIFSFMKLVDK